MKIVVCSDNHSNIEALNYILNKHPHADYYWHLGDSQAIDIQELGPFISIKGNNDYLNLPSQRRIQIGKYNFLLVHGTDVIGAGLKSLVYKANKTDSNIVLYGHTHLKADDTIDGIRLINPGSCSHNRDMSKPSYMIINIDDNNNLDVQFYEIND